MLENDLECKLFYHIFQLRDGTLRRREFLIIVTYLSFGTIKYELLDIIEELL